MSRADSRREILMRKGKLRLREQREFFRLFPRAQSLTA